MGVDWINLAQDRDQCNEPWSSIICQEFIDQLAYCQLLKKVCVACSWLKTEVPVMDVCMVGLFNEVTSTTAFIT
jgi:hypothetical protein